MRSVGVTMVQLHASQKCQWVLTFKRQADGMSDHELLWYFAQMCCARALAVLPMLMVCQAHSALNISVPITQSASMQELWPCQISFTYDCTCSKVILLSLPSVACRFPNPAGVLRPPGMQSSAARVTLIHLVTTAVTGADSSMSALQHRLLQNTRQQS